MRNIFLIYFCLASKLYADHWIDDHIIEYPDKETSFCEVISPFPDLEQNGLNAKNRNLLNKWYAQKIRHALSIFGSGRFENWLMIVESIRLLPNQDAILTAILPCHQLMHSYPIKLIKGLNYEELAEVARGDFISVSGKITFELNEDGILPEIISFKLLRANKIENDVVIDAKLPKQIEDTNKKNQNDTPPPTPKLRPKPRPSEPPSTPTGVQSSKGQNASREALLTASEAELFRTAVASCWAIDVSSPEAYVVITLSLQLNIDGKVINIRMLNSSGGSDVSVDKAFQSARRAILRCQGEGYPLPKSKYERWKFIEITFDPTHMRMR